ncbi:MAG: SDR family oxidoreductase [Candidatus Thiodiazotropha sp. L084R]
MLLGDSDVPKSITRSKTRLKMPDAERKRLLKHVPLGRMGSIEDVAAMIEFLLGKGGRYLTGQTFVVDGGLTA